MVYNPPIAHYSHISVKDVSEEQMKRIMGVNGSYFKSFTEVTGLKYVWWNKENNVIELWGSEYVMLDARYIMNNRIKDVQNLTQALLVEQQGVQS
jgi:hypothetical protein